MSTIYDSAEVRAGVETGEYAAQLFTWADDTMTDLRTYFDLTDAELYALEAHAEAHLPGSTRRPGPALRPTCHRCDVELVARATLTPVMAWTGMWWDHPERPGGLFGHTVSNCTPAPSEKAALAAQAHVTATGGSTR